MLENFSVLVYRKRLVNKMSAPNSYTMTTHETDEIESSEDTVMPVVVEDQDEGEDEEVEESSYKTRNLEIHSRWVAANKELQEALKEGDPNKERRARNEIDRIGGEFTQANAGLAVRTAKAFFNPGSDSAKDYLQAAHEGLWAAFCKWDPTLGVSFGTFSRNYMRGTVHRAVRSVEYSQLSQTDFNLRSKVQAVQRKLQTLLERVPTCEEIAAGINELYPGFSVTATAVERTLARRAVSLDTPVGDGDSTLGDLVAESEAMSGLSEAELERLESLFGCLTETELWVMVQRHGLAGAPPQSLVEVADGIGIGREIARRTEKTAISKLAVAAQK